MDERFSNRLGSVALGEKTAFNRTRTRIEQFSPDTGVGGGAAGAFFTMFEDEGDTYLQGGAVSGGSGNQPVADIKVVDADTGPIGAPGQSLILTAAGDGLVVDGILMPEFDVTGVTQSEGTPGSNTLPTVDSPSGSCEVYLGMFNATGFRPAGPGNIVINFCYGGFSPSRY